jgi:DNA-binding transcriptional LysR family regulator
MELRHIRAFIAVAEERHFRRAAERLGMAQPPLSMQIKALERELGTLLLRRTRRSVELTESGKLVLHECRRIVADVERTVAVAERAERGEQGHLEIGFTGSSAFNPFVPRAIRTFRSRFPFVELSLAEHNTLALVEAVRSNALDAAFIRPPIETADDITIETVLEEDLLVALPAAHPLARERALDIAALSHETFLMRPRHIGSGLTDGIIAAFHAAGVRPTLSRHAAPQMSSVLNLVAAGLGVSIVPSSMRQVLPTEVAYRPISGPIVPRAPLAIVSRTRNDSAVIANFIQLVREMASAQQNASERKSTARGLT